MGAYRIGEIIYCGDVIELNRGKDAVSVTVTNNGDRPIQVGSHYHFIECNFALSFDREAALGRHLDIPSGTAARFDPGEDRVVRLVNYSGNEKIMGFNGLTMGDANDMGVRERALEKMREREREEC